MIKSEVVKWISIMILGCLYNPNINTKEEELKEEIIEAQEPEREISPHVKAVKQYKLKIHWDENDLNKILDRYAKESQVLMFGNDHVDIRDAKFVASILDQLKEEGFEYVAIEGGIQLDDYLGEPGFIQKCKKLYGSQKADSACSCIDYLIQRTTELEMKVIFYDENVRIGSERDEMQFRNIKERIFDKDPNAKVVIYCGTGHANKEPIKPNFLSQEIDPLGMLLDKYLEDDVRTILLETENTFMPFWLFDANLDLAKGNPYCRHLYVDEVCVR